MKTKIESIGAQTYIKCKLDWAEQVMHSEVRVFDKKLIRGLMKPIIKGSRRIEYTVPGGIPLSSYLKGGLDKDSFFMVFAQIVEMIKKVEINELSLQHLYLDLNCTFINENTKELYFMYAPVNINKYELNVNAFLCDMAYASVFQLNEDVSFINDLVEYLNKMEGFSVNKMEEYIFREYPEVYNSILRHEYIDDKEIEESNDESNREKPCVDVDSEKKAFDEIEEHDDSFVEEKELEKEDEEGTETEEETIILDEEEETIILDEEDEATIILEEEEEKSILTAYLIRIKTCERIDIDTDVFFIGKGEKANYIITDNNTISRLHAEIICENDSYYIKDNKSTNGTFIDDILLPAEELIELNDGYEITFANEKFEFHIEETVL